MAETNDKIAALHKKIASKQKQRDKQLNKIKAAKAAVKTFTKEINEISDEINNLEIKRLSETLDSKGICVSDVEDAIAAGLIKKKAVTQSKADVTKNSTGDTNITDEPNKEGETNEAGDS